MEFLGPEMHNNYGRITVMFEYKFLSLLFHLAPFSSQAFSVLCPRQLLCPELSGRLLASSRRLNAGGSVVVQELGGLALSAADRYCMSVL